MAIEKENSTTRTVHGKKDSSSSTSRMGHLLARKTRIEHWAYKKSRSSSISDRDSTTGLTLQNVVAQKRSESLYSQTDRKLRSHLLQLSEQRQKVIDHHNFEQKIFANKQALKHKDNPSVNSTLSYVRKCCKYADETDGDETSVDPRIFLEENQNRRRSRSRSPSVSNKRSLSRQSSIQTSASLTETFLQHNRKHLESHRSTPNSRKQVESRLSNETTINDDENQKRHVQFRIHPENNENESLINKIPSRNIISALGVRSHHGPVKSDQQRPVSSAPLIRTVSTSNQPAGETENFNVEPKRRSISRIRSPIDSLKEFRLHPERFLSPSNRYLPLLRRQALEAEQKASFIKEQREKVESLRRRLILTVSPSRMSDGSDMTYDDAKSFLSEEFDFGKFLANSPTNEPKIIQTSNKINVNETIVEDSNERRLLFSRLREREFSHLNELIQTKSVEPVLETLSPMKTDQIQPEKNEKTQRNHFSSTNSKSSSMVVRFRPLTELVTSIDSLQCADINDQRARRQVNLEMNRAKLGILIF